MLTLSLLLLYGVVGAATATVLHRTRAFKVETGTEYLAVMLIWPAAWVIYAGAGIGKLVLLPFKLPDPDEEE